MVLELEVLEHAPPPSHSSASLNHGTLKGCSLAADAPDPRQGFARDVDKVPRRHSQDSSSSPPFPESRYQGVGITNRML